MSQLSLYVGDLSPNVTESVLFEHFSPIGTVTTVRVCFDLATRKSLGYGYVNFQSAAEADKAMEELNGSKILGRPCRIARVQRDPTSRKSGVNNIFVSNLPAGIVEASLQSLFSKFGRIMSMKLPRRNSNEETRGYAYISFEKEEQAAKAVENANEMELEGQQIKVERYKNMAGDREAQKLQFTNTFVRNLKKDIQTPEQLQAIFGHCGKITSCMARHSRDERMTIAFIAFDNHDSAQKLVDEFNGKESEYALEGSTLLAGRFMARKERNRLRELQRQARQAEYNQHFNLYVKNLDETVDDAKLREMFAKFGEIASVHVQRDPSGTSREFGFVSFKERAAAEAAIQEMSASTAYGMRPLYVCTAQRKDVRRAQIEEAARKRAMNPAPGAMGGMGAMGMMSNPMMMGQGAMYGAQRAGMFPTAGMPGQYPVPGMFPNAGLARMPFAGQQPMGQPMAQPMMQPRPIARAQPPAMMQRPDASNIAAYLSSLPAEAQKNALGERLYMHIQKSHPDYASKVTGMLLEMDNSEILHLLEQPIMLENKVREALDVLKRHTQS